MSVNLESILTVFSYLVVFFLGFYLPYYFDRKKEEHKKVLEYKIQLYVKLTRIIQEDFLTNNDQKRFKEKMDEILSEVYLIAPDEVVVKLRKIFIEAKDTKKFKYADFSDIIIKLRKEIIGRTKITPKEIFYLKHNSQK